MITFPQFPQYHVYITYFASVSHEVLSAVKQELKNGNSVYDYCFISTAHVISLDQLHCSLHRSVQNHALERMRANTINTEILYNLSPTNNINEAIKRFGVDESRSDVIVVKVAKDAELDEKDLQEKLQLLLNAESCEISDQTLHERVDTPKFKKLFKITGEKTVGQMSQEAIAGGLLRGC